VKGTNLSKTTRQWAAEDFLGPNAPTSLDGVTVQINGLPGSVYYISPTQINVQAPDDAAIGQVPVTVSNCAGISPAFFGQKGNGQPGMLAPAAFKVGDTQYLAALFNDGVTFVGDVGLIPGAAFRPAKSGDIITAYGVGFGAVVPPIPAGVVVSERNALPGVTIRFATVPATVTFAGLAPGAVGLYQFNFIVPDIPDGVYKINIVVGNRQSAQQFSLTVRR
jgi:uncharacterized protein (TIGR03437 family)